MSKPVISREQFIVEVNQRLPKHHAYQAGWRVFLFPEGAAPEAVTGWGIEPRSAIGHIRQVTDHVFSLFAIDAAFGREPIA